MAVIVFSKYVFVTELVANAKDKSIHEELAMHLKKILQPTQADNLVIGKFMRHSWFFFEILIKSMAQHLLYTGRIKVRLSVGHIYTGRIKVRLCGTSLYRQDQGKTFCGTSLYRQDQGKTFCVAISIQAGSR